MVYRQYKDYIPTGVDLDIDLSGLTNLEGIYDLFRAQKKRKIHRSSFDSDVWEVTNQYNSVSIYFKRLDKKYREIIDIIKYYAILLIESEIITSARTDIHFLIKVINDTDLFDVDELVMNEHEYIVLKGFWELVKFDASYIRIDTSISRYSSKQRKLCSSFDSYYIFDDVLKRFWETATREEKIIYGPLKLYWDVCNIIPTRPSAFCLLPKNCVKAVNGEYYLIMRPSYIKGTGRKPLNNIFMDSPGREKRINKTVAYMILEYRDSIKDSLVEGDDFLFNNEYYNRMRKSNCDRHFKRSHLEKLLNLFYEEVVSRQYEVRELADDEVIDFSGNVIEKIKLGDLRHLSIISMIFLGIDPSVIMDAADHQDISSSCHYYSNAGGFKNTYIRFLDLQGKRKNKELRFRQPDTLITMKNMYIVDGGICLCPSEERAKNCAKHIDHCDCLYFQPQNKNQIYGQKEKIDIEIAATINSLRQENLSKNEIMDALKRIQDDLERSRRLEILCRHM